MPPIRLAHIARRSAALAAVYFCRNRCKMNLAEARSKHPRSRIPVLIGALTLLAHLATASQKATPTSPLSLLVGLHAKLAGIALGEDSFRQVQVLYGTAQETRSGDAGYSRAEICYRGAGAHASARLAFISGPVDISSLVITEVELSAHVDEPELQGCARSTAVTPDMPILDGLKLGMPDTEIRKLLGPPTTESTNGWYYRIEKRVTYRQQPADIVGWISIDFSSGISTKMRIGRTFTT
jgi:hypothetical protein